MFDDELTGIYPAPCVRAIPRTDERHDEFAHLKMQMCEVLAIGISDRRDLLTATNILRRRDKHLVDMRVVRLNVFPRAVFLIGMQDDDDVAPTRTAFARKQHAAVSHGVNRIAEIAVFSANTIEIVAQMAILGETLRVVGKGPVLIPERKIETRRRGQ